MKTRRRTTATKRRRIVLPQAEARLESDEAVGFIAGVTCICCWRSIRKFPEDQLPRTPDKYKLCRACLDGHSSERARYEVSA